MDCDLVHCSGDRVNGGVRGRGWGPGMDRGRGSETTETVGATGTGGAESLGAGAAGTWELGERDTGEGRENRGIATGSEDSDGYAAASTSDGAGPQEVSWGFSAGHAIIMTGAASGSP